MATVDELLDSLVVPSQDGYISASTALKERKGNRGAMTAAMSSPHSSQDLAFKNRDRMFDHMDSN